MIISFRCSPRLKQQIVALVEAGLYPDVSAFCETAIENQLLLEQAHPDSPTRERHSQRTKSKVNPAANPVRKRAAKEPRYERTTIAAASGEPSTTGLASIRPSDPRGESEGLVHPADRTLFPPDKILLSRAAKPPFSLPEAFSDIFHLDEEIPVDRWLFGQYNRILPVKVSMRALCSLAEQGKDALVLETVAPRIAEAAAQFGSCLQSLDRRFGIHRDESLATAFPDLGVEGQKGRVRFQNQFVGHTVKGEQGGLLVGLKLAVIQVTKNKPHIFPTVAGWEFARLSNPLLDDPTPQMPIRFGEEEIAFLLQHVKDNVPVELFAYRVILSLITDGLRTPESLNQGLASYLSPGKTLRDEEDFVSTQRTGAIGRIADLGLVGRERQSTRISYLLTIAGRKFLEEIGRSSKRVQV